MKEATICCARCGMNIFTVAYDDIVWPLDFTKFKPYNDGLDPLAQDEPVCPYCLGIFQPIPIDTRMSRLPLMPLMSTDGVLHPPAKNTIKTCACGCGREMPQFGPANKIYYQKSCRLKADRAREKEKANA